MLFLCEYACYLQAFEAEVLVPISLASADTSIILAGDPKQLGATVNTKPLNASLSHMFGLSLYALLQCASVLALS
jgi:superfamily I DNA and/or RNA helicase